MKHTKQQWNNLQIDCGWKENSDPGGIRTRITAVRRRWTYRYSTGYAATNFCCRAPRRKPAPSVVTGSLSYDNWQYVLTFRCRSRTWIRTMIFNFPPNSWSRYQPTGLYREARQGENNVFPIRRSDLSPGLRYAWLSYTYD